MGVSLPFTSLVCPGWLLRCLLSRRIHLPLLSLQRTASFPHPSAAQPPPSLFWGAAGFQDTATSGPLVPPADCHDASHCAAATSCHLIDAPPPVCKCLSSRWPLVCQLVVVSPLLSRCCCLSSFQHAASTSYPFDMQPALQRAASALQHAAASCLLAPLLLFASLLMAGSHISSRCTTASSVHPWSMPSFTLAGCCISSCRAASAYYPLINTAASWCAGYSPPILFAYHLPQLVACVFDLVCPISRFMAICQGYVPTYLFTTGGGVYLICPYPEKCKIGLT
jgi:hypothetical protein